MTFPFLSTKLYIPPVRRKLVSRPRLTEQLNKGLENNLILISAPAGYGKTTLLSIWLSQCPHPAAWLSLDESDNDLTRFLTYLVAALQKIRTETGKTVLTMLQSPQVLPTNVILSTLINDLTQFPDQFILVLDDYHAIQEEKVHQALNFLLQELPWQMHLVVSTRADPPLPLARLRARSQMLEIRGTDLSFTEGEAEEFLNQAMGLTISKDGVGKITARTEGWIAGLQMAAVSMQGRQDTSHFIENFAGSNRHVLDYLMEEVLERQPETIQTFLLKTSILDNLNGPLCDAVTNRNDGQAMLEWLDRANLFVFSLDDQRFGYRYHHLFSDLLRQRLQKTQPNLMSALHLQASKWYEENNFPADAIRHAFSAGDFNRAARLIEHTADTTLLRGEIKTFLSWVEKIPETVARQRPILCVYHAEALMLSGRPIDQVALRLEGAPEYEAVQVLNASYLGDVELSKRLSERVLKRLPPESAFLKGIITSSFGVVLLLSGDVEPAIQTFQASADINRKNGMLILEVIAFCRLGQLHQVKGELRMAEGYFKKALELSINWQGEYLPIASMPLSYLAYLMREWNHLESAIDLIQKAIELTQESGGFWSVDCYVIHAFVLQAQGEFNKARDAIGKARKIASMTVASRVDDIYTAAYEARIFIAQGDFDAAVLWSIENKLNNGGEAGSLRAEDRYNPLIYQLVETEQMTLVRIFISLGKVDQALAILAPLLTESERLGRRGMVIENLILQALVFQAKGQITDALNVIEAVLSMAKAEGFFRVFIDEGLPMERLLKIAVGRGIARDYILKLLDGFENVKTIKTSSLATGMLIEPLSARELEVLGLIEQGLSNAEIASKLYISLSTVKGHVSNIFGKLNASSRTQAVSRARSMGLLASE